MSNTQSVLLLTEERQSVSSNNLVTIVNPVKTDKKLVTQFEAQKTSKIYFLSDFYHPDLRYACSHCGSVDVIIRNLGRSLLHERCLDCNHDWLEEIKYS